MVVSFSLGKALELKITVMSAQVKENVSILFGMICLKTMLVAQSWKKPSVHSMFLIIPNR